MLPIAVTRPPQSAHCGHTAFQYTHCTLIGDNGSFVIHCDTGISPVQLRSSTVDPGDVPSTTSVLTDAFMAHCDSVYIIVLVLSTVRYNFINPPEKFVCCNSPAAVEKRRIHE